MGKAATTAKNKYNSANYDRIAVNVAKGKKDCIKDHALTMGESTNAFIVRAILETIERDRARKS